MATSNQQSGAGQKDRKVYIWAILLSVVPMYAAVILIQVAAGEEPFTMEGFFAFLTINGAVSLTVIYLLQRYLLGERFKDLSFEAGKWWQDVLSIIFLTFVSLVVLPFIIQPVLDLLPPQEMSDLENLFTGLAENWWVAALFIGPVLMLGVGFEEISRAFFLKHAWKAGPSRVAQWFNILLSALVFGLAHLYQGPTGIVRTAIYGLVMAVYYRFFGRLWPMVVSHYLHDAIQFVMVIVMIRGGMVVF
jgi:membrane protease YdiL (CAAX protease family)